MIKDKPLDENEEAAKLLSDLENGKAEKNKVVEDE